MRILQLLMILASWTTLLFLHPGLRAQHAYIPIPSKNVTVIGMSMLEHTNPLPDCLFPTLTSGPDTLIEGKQWHTLRDTNCFRQHSQIHTLWRQDSAARKVYGYSLYGYLDSTYEEYLLMDFNLMPGDTFYMPRVDTIRDGIKSLPLKVIAVDSMLLPDGKWHYRQWLRSVSPIYNVFGNYRIDPNYSNDSIVCNIEGIGNMGGGAYLKGYNYFLPMVGGTIHCFRVNGEFHFSHLWGAPGEDPEQYCTETDRVWQLMALDQKAPTNRPVVYRAENNLHFQHTPSLSSLALFDLAGRQHLTSTITDPAVPIEVPTSLQHSLFFARVTSPDGQVFFSHVLY